MNQTISYTPLECLLLFQSLVTHGTDDDAFHRISELLTNSVLVKDGDTYDAARLTPDALRELYLLLLREEEKAEDRDGQEEDGGQPASKKRKLPTPPPPTIKDVQLNKEKLPLLVERLYARYHDYMIRAIRDDERRYASLQEEINEIERGEWDERILEEDRALASKTMEASTEQLSPKMNGTVAAGEIPQESVPEVNGLGQDLQGTAIPDKRRSPRSPQPTFAPKEVAAVDIKSAKDVDRSITPVPQQPPRNGTPGAAFPANPQLGNNAPQSAVPLYNSEPNHSGMAYKWEPPYQAALQQPPLYQPGASYQQLHVPQYSPGPHPSPHSPRSSFPPHGILASHAHLPSSPLNPQHSSSQHPHPVLLPPPNTAQGPPGSPVMPLSDISVQHYRPSSASPMHPQSQPANYGYPLPPSRPLSSNGPPPSQWNQPYLPQYQPQQFQYQPVPGHRTSFAPPPSLIQPENRQYNSPYNAHQGPRPLFPQSRISNSPRTTPRPSLPSTPLSQAIPHFITGTGTRWTPTALGATPKTHTVTESPAMEPLSPTAQPAELPKPVKRLGRPPKKRNLKPQSPVKVPVSVSKRGLRRTRAGSTPSSVMARSYRSQSELSQTDELSMDNDFASRPLKQERDTPLGIDDTGDTTADDFPGRAFASPRPNAKRKRKDSILSPFSPKPSALSTHVLWTRNFPKMSASALESIAGHRTASTFAAPVKERDAPGYKHLILRPQDLSSIRKAVNAGHRAGAAAAPSDLHPSQTSAWLPISEELIPPKGIINYAQFEKELMRVFANAIMFNPDPERGLGRRWDVARDGRGEVLGYAIEEDGVVKDTRAMLKDVEGWLRNLRGAVEGRSEGGGGLNSSVGPSSSVLRKGSSVMADDDEVDELAGDGAGVIGPAAGNLAKRRRKL